jgi:peptide deformylase
MSDNGIRSRYGSQATLAPGPLEQRSGHRPEDACASGSFRIAVRRVLTRPDVRLAIPAAEIDPLHPYVVALADALLATMRVSPACVGLAATQIGEPARVFCMDVTGHKKARSCAGLVVMCNPVVVWRSKEVVQREGCMSVPDFTGDVARAAEVTVEGQEPGTGAILRVDADGIEARCLLHEIDHLDGFVFVDRVQNPGKHLFARKTFQ